MEKKINWNNLSSELKTNWNGFELGGSSLGIKALELILGENALKDAADCFILGRPGFALANSVLRVIRPQSVMNYCYEIYKSDTDITNRRMAVTLLKDIADKSALAWIDEFLQDADSEIQLWGSTILEQLIYLNFVQVKEAEQLITKAEQHKNEGVREQAKLIRNLPTE